MLQKNNWVILAALVLVPVFIHLGRRGEPRGVTDATAAAAAIAPAAEQADALAEAMQADVPEEVKEFLRAGLNWRAARRMRTFLAATPEAGPEEMMVAARAEAGWGGWPNVRELLQGKPWLDEIDGGDGWLLLGQALEEEKQWMPAANAYARFLAASRSAADADQRIVAELRRGLVLLRAGQVEQGTAALAEVRDHAPGVAAWAGALMADALAERGDTARIRALVAGTEADAPTAEQIRRAYIGALRKVGDERGARAAALYFRSAATGNAERAGYTVLAARAAVALGDAAAAKTELRAVLADPASAGAVDAARTLLELGGLSAADQLRIGRIYDRNGNNTRAATGYRAWLAAGAGTAAEQRQVRLWLGQALFDGGKYAEAETALRPLLTAPADVAAEATYLTGRAQYRGGNRTQAKQTFLRTAERFPGTGPGAEALFLVADLSHDNREFGEARRLYRRVADRFPGNSRAGLALMRLGGMQFLNKDYVAAAKIWEEARAMFPSGGYWNQATYWAGRAYQGAGNETAAAARFREMRVREPLSYYSVRAAERLNEPYWPIPLAPAPNTDAQTAARVRGWMRPVKLLGSAGLYTQAERAADAAIAGAGENPRLLYPLAEALIESGFTVRGVRIARKLQELEPQLNPRLLRVLYPFPHRDLITAEARENKLDPFMVAALTRQESTFKPRISSAVGARGLMQIMPKTGRALARGADLDYWDPEILFNPEINVHLGTRYLADQMRTYGGNLPAVFSAYNAGPVRIDRWKRIFPEFGDDELFTERIPYSETRDYVKILTRNREIYRGLYGGAEVERSAR